MTNVDPRTIYLSAFGNDNEASATSHSRKGRLPFPYKQIKSFIEKCVVVYYLFVENPIRGYLYPSPSRRFWIRESILLSSVSSSVRVCALWSRRAHRPTNNRYKTTKKKKPTNVFLVNVLVPRSSGGVLPLLIGERRRRRVRE
uniref:Uncharacterized protein n=1 Tax=Acrobeloides nanus TaxID=290746 RepID=A0A914CTB9_9BILA